MALLELEVTVTFLLSMLIALVSSSLSSLLEVLLREVTYNPSLRFLASRDPSLVTMGTRLGSTELSLGLILRVFSGWQSMY